MDYYKNIDDWYKLVKLIPFICLMMFLLIRNDNVYVS